MTETTTAGPVLRAVTVVVGPRRHDVLVDENLALGDLIELVAPGSGLRPFTLAGIALMPVQTLAQARLAAGSVLLAAEPQAPGPQRPGPLARPAGPVPGGPRPAAPAPRASAPEPPAPLAPALAPGAGSSRAELAAVATAWVPTPGPALPSAPRADAARPAAVAGLALLALAGAAAAPFAVLRAYPPTGSGMPWPPVVAGLGLALAGIVLAQFGGGARPAAYVAPVSGAAAGVILGGLATAYPDAGLVGACAGAALVALAAPGRTETARRVARVWTGFAVGVGAIGLWALAVGAPAVFPAALVLAAATLLPLVVPSFAIDVDHDVLLDFARLSVTSWTPRERRGPARSAWRLDQDAVDRLVGHAAITQTAVLAGVAVVTVGAGAVLGLLDAAASAAARSAVSSAVHSAGPSAVHSAVSSVVEWEPTRWLLLASATALLLTARGFRRRADRRLLQLAAAGPAVALVLPVAVSADPATGLTLGLAAAVAGAALALGARGAGRRRRSLTGIRLADAIEGVAVVAVLPLALWAAGVVDWCRGLLG